MFSNILTILSLAELGAGGAFVSLLYGPLAKHDIEQLSTIMAVFKKVYFAVGCIIGLFGLCFIPFMDFFTTGSTIPNLTLIYLLFLGNSVVTYFCADKKALITADQKSYVITTYLQIFVIVQYAVQILVLLLTHNFIFYLCVQIACAIGFNLYVVRKARILYPYLGEKAKPLTANLRKDIKQKIAGGFCVHAGYVVASGTDSLVISHFLGLAVLGIYSNYLLIIGIIMKISDMVISAVQASASNLVVSSSNDVSYSFFRKLNFLTLTMLGFFCTCLVTLFNPFIMLWVGSEYVMKPFLVILAVLLYFTGWHGFKLSLSIYRNALGLYYRDRYISLLEGILNLTISLLLVKPLGLVGVFIGTLISSLCTTISSAYLVYRHVFHRPISDYWKSLLGYLLIFTVTGCLTYWVSGLVPHGTWPLLFVMALVCAGVTILCYVLAFFKTEEFKYFLDFFKNTLRRKNPRRIS